MSGRIRMHPKNIYKNPPNFKELAIEYPEFREYVKQELSGRLVVDYSDAKAVKALTQTLLKKDFNLVVNIDETRLIPRLPLCLNYILWVEDLLACLSKESNYCGIDLGTGCASIYSLLGAKRGWNMLATEVDPVNFKSAQDNIEHNNLKNQITVRLVSNPNQLLVNVLDSKENYDFCMCNPPFFDVKEKPSNRTLRRPQIEGVASQVTTEISTSGGEVSFLTKLIEESEQLKGQVKIYTTLVGKKCDLASLRKELQKVQPKSVTFTEFCQGRTMRWGLAWTYMDISLKNSSGSQKTKRKKPKSFLQVVLPVNETSTLDKIFEEVKNCLTSLEISFKEEIEGSCLTATFKANKNTWSHQRRKKRLEARNNEKEDQISNCKADSNCKNESSDECSCAKRLRLDQEEDEEKDSNIEATNNSAVIVEGAIFLREENSSAVFEMTWLSGDKESLHQIFQYFKNHWNKNI